MDMRMMGQLYGLKVVASAPMAVYCKGVRSSVGGREAR